MHQLPASPRFPWHLWALRKLSWSLVWSTLRRHGLSTRSGWTMKLFSLQMTFLAAFWCFLRNAFVCSVSSVFVSYAYSFGKIKRSKIKSTCNILQHSQHWIAVYDWMSHELSVFCHFQSLQINVSHAHFAFKADPKNCRNPRGLTIYGSHLLQSRAWGVETSVSPESESSGTTRWPVKLLSWPKIRSIQILHLRCLSVVNVSWHTFFVGW